MAWPGQRGGGGGGLFLLVFNLVLGFSILFRDIFPPPELPWGGYTGPGEPVEFPAVKGFEALLREAPTVDLSARLDQTVDETASGCDHFGCFDVYRCGAHHTRMLVHVPSPVNYVDGSGVAVAPWSKEFVEILEAIRSSKYYTDRPEEACLFVPPIDLLREDSIKSQRLAGLALSESPLWSDGTNHLIFNFLPGSQAELGVPHGRAMVAGAGLSTQTYREGFDVALPTVGRNKTLGHLNSSKRRWLVISTQEDLSDNRRFVLEQLQKQSPHDVLVLNKCHDRRHSDHVDKRCLKGRTYSYVKLLEESTFCLFLPGTRLTHPGLVDAMRHGCVPVIANDALVLPFSERLDWARFSLRIYEQHLPRLLDTLASLRPSKIKSLQDQMQSMYERHFSSVKSLTLTTLDILSERLLPHVTRDTDEWNPDSSRSSNPLSLTYLPDATEGFTAVILTYDRVDSLFEIMTRLADVQSCSHILVVWNNQLKSPPPHGDWPKISKPFKVIRTKANLLSNRFFPYEDIRTECVLSMDDDITMLTADELELGYRTWRENPDRLVGFPSRTHVLGEDGRWRYEPEWTNDISMVLTGAAFYHNFWHYLYTAAPSAAAADVKKMVDDAMNCEDIAMNFLVANWTGKAPIKVGPRKKFRCVTPECNNDSDLALSGIQSHMMHRSECMDAFAALYGHMPLRPAEFRADAALYLDGLPERLKWYNDVGSL